MSEQTDRQHERETWAASVRSLCNDILRWSEEKRWATHEDKKQITEDLLGTYQLPFLMIRPPSGVVHVDPVGRDIVNAEGRVDVFTWPTLDRMVLVRTNGDWEVLADDYSDWSRLWGKETFLKMIDHLAEQAQR